MEFLKALLALFLSMISIFNIFDGPNHVTNPVHRKDFEYLEYPAEAIINPEDVGLTVNSYKSRGDDDGDELYVNAQGYTDINGVIDSPYFTMHVEGKRIPVYSTTVFVGSTQKGELHSFCEIYVDTKAVINYEFQINTKSFSISSVDIFSNGLNPEIMFSSNVVNGKISRLGTYTFVFNNNDQIHGFTLFVRELVDDEEEIAKYKEQYGESNVVVVEKGLHNSDAYFDLYGSTNMVYYLKRGSYLLAKHTIDINNETDDANNVESAANGRVGLGLTRFPYMNFHLANNVKLVGNGMVDLSHLDRRERRGLVFSYCTNIEVDGIKIVNPPEWSFITYDCENVTIKNVDIFGYRQNSDAFAICNTRNATIDNSFCRSGDDLFDVKTAGGRPEAISQNISFTNCTAWNGKARCFGICGEVNMPINDVTFKDSTVVFHDATWNADRIPALAIIVEQGGGSISNVTFDNIEINYVANRPIGCLIYENTVQNMKLSNITYKNIRYKSGIANKISTKNISSNSISASFENIEYNGLKVTDLNSGLFEYDNNVNITIK